MRLEVKIFGISRVAGNAVGGDEEEFVGEAVLGAGIVGADLLANSG